MGEKLASYFNPCHSLRRPITQQQRQVAANQSESLPLFLSHSHILCLARTHAALGMPAQKLARADQQQVRTSLPARLSICVFVELLLNLQSVR